MEQNFGNCKIIKFEPCEQIDAQLESFAEDFFEVIEINYTDDGQEQLIGYMRLNTADNELIVAAKKWGVDLPPYSVELLRGRDWLKENVIKFAPVEVDEFYVYGIHENNVDKHGKIGIKIYAATAFGSEHQTTKCCLRGISEINCLINTPQKVLDVGTGSGILSLAAAKLWKNAQIVAVDIDDESVKVTEQNAIDNGVEKQIIAAYSDGYASEIVQKNAPYDVILANILARPLIAMAKDMAKNLKVGGYAVISGFIDEQVDWVVGEHEKYGLQLQKIYEDGQWHAALLKRI
ncbi:MAG: 50S ribosomal protein L11 methyltransferase [Alphaproteobacteria bacterium]|nr:50S ribosomal protein L11 methyltransferase [Alphaproteobacteria bacterium]